MRHPNSRSYPHIYLINTACRQSSSSRPLALDYSHSSNCRSDTPSHCTPPHKRRRNSNQPSKHTFRACRHHIRRQCFYKRCSHGSFPTNPSTDGCCHESCSSIPRGMLHRCSSHLHSNTRRQLEISLNMHHLHYHKGRCMLHPNSRSYPHIYLINTACRQSSSSRPLALDYSHSSNCRSDTPSHCTPPHKRRRNSNQPSKHTFRACRHHIRRQCFYKRCSHGSFPTNPSTDGCCHESCSSIPRGMLHRCSSHLQSNMRHQLEIGFVQLP